MAAGYTLTDSTERAGSGNTVSNIPIGAASADRLVVIAFLTQDAGLSAVTIGGVSALAAQIDIGASRMALAWAPVPTGTTANLVCSGANPLYSFGAVALTGVEATYLDANGGVAASTNIETADGGVVIGFSVRAPAAGVTWPVLSEAFDYAGVGGAANVSLARQVPTTAQTPMTVAATGASAIVAVSFSALPASTGTLTTSEGSSDTFAGSGGVTVSGGAAAAESEQDTATASGSVLVAGSLAATETGADGFAASGTVASPAIEGELAATEAGADAATISGTVLVSGSLEAAETGVDGLAASGTVAWPGVEGTLTALETGSDTAALSGAVLVAGSLAVAESGGDTASANGAALVGGAMAATETGGDAAAIAGVVPVSGSLAASEAGGDVAAFTDVVAVFRFGVYGPSVPAIDAGPDWLFISDALAAEPVALTAYAGWTSWTNASAGSIDASVDQSRYPATPDQRLWGQYQSYPDYVDHTPITVSVGGLDAGAYRVVIYAREHWAPFTAAGQRVFTIACNAGDPVTVDLAGDYGPLTLGAITLDAVVDGSGELDVTFVGLVEAPTWDAIEILRAEEELGEITGTLSATEAGGDALAADGAVLVRVAAAAAEVGPDAATIIAAVVVSGAMAAQESGADTAAALGFVLIQGGLAATETGSDTFRGFSVVVHQPRPTTRVASPANLSSDRRAPSRSTGTRPPAISTARR